MYIGELAKLTGCTPKAIRLYEQLGLLTPQRRGSYRLYTAHHLRLVQMIRRAQVLANQGIEVKRLELQAQILALQDRQQQHLAVEHCQGGASLRVTDPGAHLLPAGEQRPHQGVAQMPIRTGDQRQRTHGLPYPLTAETEIDKAG
jgi:DNA-binding transcriptional MerR regulator